MKPTDYEAARRLQQTIPLPVRAVLALLKQHGSPEAARAAYRADQIAHISQTAGCSETEAAEHYDKHQGNTERAIRAIRHTPVYLGKPVINGEKSGYAITPLDEKGNEAAGRHAFIQSENFELVKPLFAPYFPMPAFWPRRARFEPHVGQLFPGRPMPGNRRPAASNRLRDAG